ncbi:MAG: Hsp20/alpha crystallin family protein [Gemmatimonadaceae bacterium]|nr:Hsp20/alpha crystallin family protein [Gemmatimonadaceae bacterium]
MSYYRFSVPAQAPITNFRREMDRLFEEVFTGRASGTWQPSATAREDQQGFSLDLDIPGVPVDNVEVLAEDGVLTIRGERAQRALAEGERAVISETARGKFVRQFRLPKSADLQAIQASHDNGVLSIRIAKVAPLQPRRVPVSAQSPNVTSATTAETLQA